MRPAFGWLAAPGSLIAVVAVFCLLACEEMAPPPPAHARGPSKQQRAVEALGLTSVKMGGPPLFGCSDDDAMLASANFRAVNASGASVEGVVCCGFVFKGCTVRFE